MNLTGKQLEALSTYTSDVLRLATMSIETEDHAEGAMLGAALAALLEDRSKAELELILTLVSGTAASLCLQYAGCLNLTPYQLLDGYTIGFLNALISYQAGKRASG